MTIDKYKKTIFLAIFLTILTSLFSLQVTASDYSTTIRLHGNTRVETSIKVSQEIYPPNSSTDVVLSGYHGEVDALTGTLLASTKNAPLLLVDKFENIENELIRLGVENVYLLGGEKAISKNIEQKLKSAGYSVFRIYGRDRLDTAIEIAYTSTDPSHDDVFLANDGRSGSLADALAIAPVSGMYQTPVLLTSKNKLPQETLQAMQNMNIQSIKIIGGTNVVSQAIENELVNKGFEVDRIAGHSRWHTTKIIADTYFNSGAGIITNDGYAGSFADALVAGYVGAKMNIPLLLTDTNSLNSFTYNYLTKSPTLRYVIGGEHSISHQNLKAIIKTEGETIKVDTIKQVEPAHYVFIQHDGLPEGKEIISEQARNGVRKTLYKSVISEDQTYDNILVRSKISIPPVHGKVYIGTSKKLQQFDDTKIVAPYTDLFKQSGWKNEDFSIYEGKISGFTDSGRQKALNEYKGLSLVLPDQDDSGQVVHTIGKDAFKNFYFERMRMPDTILTIEDRAFKNVNLLYTEFSNSLQLIGNDAFTVNNFSNNVHFDTLKSIEKIGDYAFNFAFSSNQSHQFNFEKLDSLKIIGEGAFTGNNIISVTFPEGLTIIDADAFAYNPIHQVYLPFSLKELGDHAFDENVGLKGNIDF